MIYLGTLLPQPLEPHDLKNPFMLVTHPYLALMLLILTFFAEGSHQKGQQPGHVRPRGVGTC